MSDTIFLDATWTGSVFDDTSMDERGSFHLGTITWQPNFEREGSSRWAEFTPLCGARENGRASWPVQAENLRHEKAAWPSGRFPCCAECRTEMEVRERGRDDITAEWRDRTELGTWDEIKFGGDAA